MIRSYGSLHPYKFPKASEVLKLLEPGNFAHVTDTLTEKDYILTPGLTGWTMVDDIDLLCTNMNRAILKSEWVMSTDDFENGWGEREYPHCSNCLRGVYRHDAGNWCPFCGTPMKNPMR